MNDPRTHPVPGAEVEVLGKNKSSRRAVHIVHKHGDVTYFKAVAGGWKIATCTLAAWRKWAFNGHVVARGQE